MAGTIFNLYVVCAYLCIVNGVACGNFMPVCTEELRNALKSASLKVTIIKRRGSVLVLPCQFCGYEENVLRKSWLCTAETATAYETLKPDDRVDIAPSGALKITNLNPSDARNCHCTSAGSSSNLQNYTKLEFVVDVEQDILLQGISGSFYDWAVFQSHSYIFVNLMLSNPQLGPIASSIRASPDWTEWSSCDPCEDDATESPSRRRTASCRLKSLHHPKTDSISLRHLMQMYDRGLSCISSRHFSTFSRRIQSALIIPPFTVLEKCNRTGISGSEIEGFEIIYKVIVSEIITISLRVRQRSFRAFHDTPATWYNGSRRLNPTMIIGAGDTAVAEQTYGGRLFLDADQMLHIVSVTVYDSNVYVCWALRRERASIQVVVKSARGFKESLRHSIYVAMAAAMSFVFYVVAIAIFRNHWRQPSAPIRPKRSFENEHDESAGEVLVSSEEPTRVQKFQLLKKLLQPKSLGF